jgi:hypothetical protein
VVSEGWGESFLPVVTIRRTFRPRVKYLAELIDEMRQNRAIGCQLRHAEEVLKSQ